jgi:hypothetical protein
MIRRVLREDLRRENVRKVRPTLTHGRTEAAGTHVMPGLHPNLSRQSQFIEYIFTFLW